MNAKDWAPYLRLQEQYHACRSPEMAQAIEVAMDRQFRALIRGVPRTGNLDTAIANRRRRERRRAVIEALAAPLMPLKADPWPAVDRDIDLHRRLRPLDAVIRSLVLEFVDGHTYADLASTYGRPLGTIKSQLFRAKRKFTA
jgi:hypothetical protein